MTGIMLGAVALHMFVPPGFMPASGRPFALEICWDGLPAGMLPKAATPDSDSMAMDSMGMGSMDMESMPMGDSAHHSGSSSQSEHCVFAATCGAGPTPHLPLPSDFVSNLELRAFAFAAPAAAVRVVHLPQPRAPPSRLS
jgi:hypothetical protein